MKTMKFVKNSGVATQKIHGQRIHGNRENYLFLMKILFAQSHRKVETKNHAAQILK